MEKEYDLDLVPKKGADLPDLTAIFDLDRLHRLHPHWVIEASSAVDGGTRFEIRDHATDERFSHTARLTSETKGDGSMPGLRLDIEGGPFGTLRLHLKAGRFVIATQQPPAEAEENLLLWLRGIREYLRLYLTTSPNTLLFRLLMNKMILPMTPSQRKICLMLWRFTLLEILVIVMIGVGWMIFMR